MVMVVATRDVGSIHEQERGEPLTSPAPAFDPKNTALLVMDFQRGVVERMPGLDPLLGRVQQAIADVRGHGGTIGYVRVAFTEADWAAVPPVNAVFAWVGENRLMHTRTR
jgi:nicotinamidase-related amidase